MALYTPFTLTLKILSKSLFRRIVQSSDVGNTGAVYQNIDACSFTGNAGDHFLYLRLIRNIDGKWLSLYQNL